MKQRLIQMSEQPGAADAKCGEMAALWQAPKPASGLSGKEMPAGRLSGVKIRNMLFQVQTEFVTRPESRVVTVVMLDGRVVMKRTRPAPAHDSARGELAKMIEELHVSVEKEINGRINDLIRKKTGSEETVKEKIGRLFEEGFHRCREHNYEAALAVWQEAYALDPVNKVLAANIRILRKKLNLTDDSCRHCPN